MENKEKKEEGGPLTFDGIEVDPKFRKNAGNLADAILDRESEEELAESFKSQGFGTDEISRLNSVLAPRRGEKGEDIKKRTKAIERLQGAHGRVVGLPERRQREEGDSLRRESGKGRLHLGKLKPSDIERRDKREN